MDTTRILALLTEVFLSWQVLAVTAAFVLFWILVGYVVKPKRAKSGVRAKGSKPMPRRTAAAAVKAAKETAPEVIEGDDIIPESRPSRRRV
jgi:hypothetical protein